MKYTLLLYYDENAMDHVPPEVQKQANAAFMAYAPDLQKAGVLVATDWLKKTTTATTVTHRNGSRQVQDGPFAEAKEQLGGYFIVDVPNLDAAIAWAEKCPVIRWGSIEIRTSMMG